MKRREENFHKAMVASEISAFKKEQCYRAKTNAVPKKVVRS